MARTAPPQEGAPRATIRLDKWLWQARFFKTRTLAAKTVAGGHVRVNATRVAKPAVAVGVGDVLTFLAGERVRVVKIRDLGQRRGPAPEAVLLYEDLSPPPPPRDESAPRSEGPRPTKKTRRSYEQTRRPPLE